MTANMKIVRDWLGKTINKSLAHATAKREQRGRAARPRKETTSRASLSCFSSSVPKTPEDLLPFLLTFVIGARDTTASALSWFFYMLSYLEATIKLLTYLEAAIKEVLGYYPPAPYTMRHAPEDIVICGDNFIRKGQLIGTSQYAMARNPRVWGPDASEFKPERWIDPSAGQILQFPPSKFSTFNAGPRSCIGMNLALLELRIVTANLLHRYEFHIVPSNDGSYEVEPTLNMKHPLLARVTAWKKS